MPKKSTATCVDCGTHLPDYRSKRCRQCRYKDQRKMAPTKGLNPSGLCLCGCGQKTWIATKHSLAHGWVRGEPVRWVNGHQQRTPTKRITPDRYVVDQVTGCWNWIGRKDWQGYGQVAFNGSRFLAHRLSFLEHGGIIPDGYVMDHLCRNTSCVNPDHLQAVTVAVNNRRGVRTKLSPDEVLAIIERAKTETQRALAKEFGLTASAIHRIVRGHSWK